MNHPTTRHSRLFYSIASIVLLVLTLIGFRMFYLHLQAFPGRPLTPPIRTLLIVHGVSMTIWMLLSIPNQTIWAFVVMGIVTVICLWIIIWMIVQTQKGLNKKEK